MPYCVALGLAIQILEELPDDLRPRTNGRHFATPACSTRRTGNRRLKPMMLR